MHNLPLRVVSCLAVLRLLSACSDDTSPPETDAAIDPVKVCELNWDVRSVVPCVAAPTLNAPPLIYSSHLNAAGVPECDPYIGFPQPVPADSWSEQTLTAETTGSARLCIAMKHGKADAPSASDCVLFEHCLDATYDEVGQQQMLPAIPGWAASDEACSNSYYDEGGYVELRVASDDLGCGEGEDQVTRIQFCPLDCVENDTRPKCKTCDPKTSVTGSF